MTLNAQDQDKLTYEEKVNPPQQADVPPDVMDRSRKDQGVKDEQEKQGKKWLLNTCHEIVCKKPLNAVKTIEQPSYITAIASFRAVD